MNHQEIMSRLNSALGCLDSAYAHIAKEHGLTYNALMTAFLINESNGITQKQICSALHLSKSTVHSILSPFIKQQYIVLIPGNNNKEKNVVFTENGRAFFLEAIQNAKDFENEILTELGEEMCMSLVEAAESLGRILSKKLPVSTQREMK
ncbi:MAG: MarR family winged helix-turn-helix transcriptional regulator [Raoultibacter sp.]|jgi:DNA-binding MarR family transcriptional regulator